MIQLGRGNGGKARSGKAMFPMLSSARALQHVPVRAILIQTTTAKLNPMITTVMFSTPGFYARSPKFDPIPAT